MSQIVKRERRASFKNDFYDTYVKLIDFIEQINHKIVGRIQLVQQIYIEDYKAQVKEMTGQLRGIRIMLDEQLLRQRSNERMFFLEQERDFFRGQVMKLNEELNLLGKREEILKTQLQQKTAESENYRSLVYNLQRKLTRIQNEAIEIQKLRSAPAYASTPSLSLPNKDVQSQSPTRAPSTTRLSPVPIQTTRQPFKSFKSIESQKKQSTIDNELLRREQILQRCIKDIKKKIFYRTLGEKPGEKVYFDEHKQVLFDKFKRSDKEQLISNILNSGQLLDQFYSFMIEKQNEKSVIKKHLGKVAFNDKIFKIKLGALTN